MPTPIVYSSPKGTAMARLAIALLRSDSPYEAARYAERAWPGMPVIAQALEKAAVGGGSAATWAAALTESGVAQDFLLSVREGEILSRLGARRAPFNVPVPIATGLPAAD